MVSGSVWPRATGPRGPTNLGKAVAKLKEAGVKTVKQIVVLTAVFAAILTVGAPAAAQPGAKEVYPGPIDVNKMDPARRAIAPYSFYVPPYNLYYFHHIDQLNVQQDWIRRSGPVFALREPSAPFSASYTYASQRHTLDEYFVRNYVVGFVVLHDNQILLEKYLHGADRESRFLSNSVSKSFTSILVGAAIADGKIKSVDDPVVKYLPWLQGSSGYRDTTIKNLLEMASGVQFDEQYTNPDADISRYASALLHGRAFFSRFGALHQGEDQAGDKVRIPDHQHPSPGDDRRSGYRPDPQSLCGRKAVEQDRPRG